jgi:alpha-beta hydrolase superfamily lysophospholipase
MKTSKFTGSCLAVFAAITLLTGSAISENSREHGSRIGKKVSFFTRDGVEIQGLYEPRASRSKLTFIFLHGLGSNQEEWQVFEKKFVRYGFGFLSYDARGHGNSTSTKTGQISYTTFSANSPDSDWRKMVGDLEDAVNFLNKEYGLPKKSIGLMGASLGANICLKYAAGEKSIPVIVLLSPGMNFAGINIEYDIVNIEKRPILIVASPGDTYSYQSSQLLIQKLKQNPKAVFEKAATGHGVNMLDIKTENTIIGWITRQ